LYNPTHIRSSNWDTSFHPVITPAGMRI